MCYMGWFVFWWRCRWRSFPLVLGLSAAEETHFLMSAGRAFDTRNDWI